MIKYKLFLFVCAISKDSPTMLVELKEICRSLGIVEWGAPEGQPVYILRLGKILDA
jgi:hypothetical protein